MGVHARSPYRRPMRRRSGRRAHKRRACRPGLPANARVAGLAPLSRLKCAGVHVRAAGTHHMNTPKAGKGMAGYKEKGGIGAREI